VAWVHRRDQPELGQRDVGEPAACEKSSLSWGLDIGIRRRARFYQRRGQKRSIQVF
jgi:hypothetical protein